MTGGKTCGGPAGANPPVALTIAGSDSGGGAGLQADLRTFAALGVFATTAVTAVTAQNTTAVRSVLTVAAEMVVEQVLTVLDDLPVAAVKTGMLGSAATVAAVADLAAAGRLPHLVVDPVMVASSGAVLADTDTIDAYRQLLPRAEVVTPNLLEAAVLTGTPDTATATVADQMRLARQIGDMTEALVVVKGGHAAGNRSVDVMWDGHQLHQLDRVRLPTRDTHGSGCTFSAALAAYLAGGAAPLQAVRLAGDFVHRAIDGGRHWQLGAGPGPLDHLGWWQADPSGTSTSGLQRLSEPTDHESGTTVNDPTPPENTGTFCQDTWAATTDLQAAIQSHPFNRALADGTLDPGRFAYYLVQDSRYLQRFSAILAAAAELATDPGDSAFFADSAARALSVEAALHAGYLQRLGPVVGGEAITTSEACIAYTSFLEGTANDRSFPVLVAALLPCFWIYQQVGTAILERTGDRPDHPYRDWIDTYADEAFAASVQEIRAIADRLATDSDPGTVSAMHRAFRRASQLEWEFWDSAWHYVPAGELPPG